jgi:ATP-dependent Clp protease adaptor protein ClpS
MTKLLAGGTSAADADPGAGRLGRIAPRPRAIYALGMASDPTKREDADGELILQQKPKIERVRRFQVVFHNDDYTTKWFVVDVLQRFFHMSETSALDFMMTVHEHGRGVAGVYFRDIAETKATQVHEHAREYGMPLRVTVEPEDD